MMKPKKEDIELYRAFQKSPILWIEKNLHLIPQPLKKGTPPNEKAKFYKPEHFEEFVEGKHITWQQWLFFRSIELAIQGKEPRKIGIQSGHGTGKSAALAIFILWFLFCFKDAQVSCTAPTSQQMFDVLWKELAFWHGRLKKEVAELYELRDTYVRIKERRKTWFARAATGRKENAEALSGVHGKHVALIGDEASGVHELIFEAVRGALTNKDIFFIVISNPTRLSGFFFNVFHKWKRRWQALRFDSRESPIVDDHFVQEIINDYGENSPQFDVRVAGKFPLSEEDQFIPTDLFDQAAERNLIPLMTAPRILGVDVAAYGDDACAYVERQGNDSTFRGERRGQDTMATVGDVVGFIQESKHQQNLFDFVCVDIIGMGRGVFDRLVEMQEHGEIPLSIKFVAVNSAEKSTKPERFGNMRAELWHDCKEWLHTADVPEELRPDLTGIKYKHDSKNRLMMEKKDDMKKRGLPSPDKGDALIMTFSVRTATRTSIQLKKMIPKKKKIQYLPRV